MSNLLIIGPGSVGFWFNTLEGTRVEHEAIPKLDSEAGFRNRHEQMSAYLVSYSEGAHSP